MRRIRLIMAAVLGVAAFALPAAAQSTLSGRLTGSVIDTSGKALKGAVITASNKDAYPPQLTSTSDDKGRFAMIGLRAGVWTVSVEAPGFLAVSGSMPIRTGTPPPPFRVVLERTPEAIPGALVSDIGSQLNQAQTLRAEGRLDQALAAYQSIHSKNPKLTTINLVIAGLYRQKGDGETDATAKQAMYDRAISTYSEVVKSDPDSSAAAEASAQIQSLKK